MGFENPNSLCVFEPFGQGEHKDRVQPIDAFAVTLKQLCGAGHGIVGHISQWPSLSV